MRCPLHSAVGGGRCILGSQNRHRPRKANVSLAARPRPSSSGSLHRVAIFPRFPCFQWDTACLVHLCRRMAKALLPLAALAGAFVVYILLRGMADALMLMIIVDVIVDDHPHDDNAANDTVIHNGNNK